MGLLEKKYSSNFERDYKFYFDNRKKFVFCGTVVPKFMAITDDKGKSGKEVFYLIDSTGKNSPTREPELLNELLLCKASVNFQIKEWAKGRADGTLPKSELIGDGGVIEWVNGEPIHFKNYVEMFNLPDWVVEAVENQKKYYYDPEVRSRD